MSYPSTISTDIASILCLVVRPTSRALLAGIGRVDLLYRDALSLCLVGDVQGELVEAPGILRAVVFAGGCPTTGACRAFANTDKELDLDRPHALLMGMIDDLSRKLVIDVLHPAGFFAFTLFDGACLLWLLQGLAASIEAAAHHFPRASTFPEPRFPGCQP